MTDERKDAIVRARAMKEAIERAGNALRFPLEQTANIAMRDLYLMLGALENQGIMIERLEGALFEYRQANKEAEATFAEIQALGWANATPQLLDKTP